MLSIILTSKFEPKTIGKAVSCLIDRRYSGLIGDYELITVIPDAETIDAVKNEIKKFKTVPWVNLKDSKKGKPAALNQAFKVAKGELILLTDGDVYLEKDAVGFLQKSMNDKKLGGVSGRPISQNSRETMFGYYGNLLSDAAHHKRKITMTDAEGYSHLFVKKSPFFPLSGYISIIKNLKLNIPEDCLVDDAYLSYVIFNKGYKIGYQSDAKVFVKYPTHIHDWMAQKLRSAGGYVQLWKYGVMKKETKTRNFYKELEYFWFPIKYARNVRELFWSLFLYPIRFYMWLRIYWERKVLNKDFSKTWTVIQSTK